jgi:hypothetical protein
MIQAARILRLTTAHPSVRRTGPELHRTICYKKKTGFRYKELGF